MHNVNLPVHYSSVDQYIDDLVSFIHEYRYLSDFESTEYLTCNAWDNFIPETWRCLAKTFDSDEEIASIAADSPLTTNLPDSFLAFLAKRKSLLLPQTMADSYSEKGIWNLPGFPMSLKKGLTAKKRHEISHFSSLVSDLAHKRGTNTTVVDLGAGQGYLGMSLCLEHDLNVVSVDDDDIQTTAAAKRVDDISVFARNKLSRAAKTLKIVNQRVEPHQNPAVVCNVSGDIVLCGLHTCGDLAPISFEWFLKSPSIRAVANVGCCYNQCTEMFDSPNPADAIFSPNQALALKSHVPLRKPGFPLSDCLKARHFSLGFSARTSAALSTAGWSEDVSVPQQQWKRIFYRALFQFFVRQLELVEPSRRLKIGRCKEAALKSFSSFAKFGMERLGISAGDQPAKDQIEQFYQQHKHYFSRVKWLWTFRCLFGEIYESLILIDRFKYLVEEAEKCSHLGIRVSLQPIFCLKKSPRNMVIVAEKLM